MLIATFPFGQISSAACIVCEFSAGTVQVGLFFLPLIGRLRLMVFCAIFSLLLTSLMVFLDISHIALMFPFNWPKLVCAQRNPENVPNTFGPILIAVLPLAIHSSAERISLFHHKCNIFDWIITTHSHGVFCP